MKKEHIVQYKANELPETTKTDWKRLDAMTDDGIDTSEIPELDDEWSFFPKKRKPYLFEWMGMCWNGLSPILKVEVTKRS